MMGDFSSDLDGGLPTSTNVFGILLCYLMFTVYGETFWIDTFPAAPGACAVAQHPNYSQISSGLI